MVQPENIHASNTIYPAKFINTHIYTNTHNHACIQTHIQKKMINENEGPSKRAKRGIWDNLQGGKKGGFI